MFGFKENLKLSNALSQAEEKIERLRVRDIAYSGLFSKIAEAMWLNHALAMKSAYKFENLKSIENVNDSDAFEQLNKNFESFCFNYKEILKEASYRGGKLEPIQQELEDVKQRLSETQKIRWELLEESQKAGGEALYWKGRFEHATEHFNHDKLANLPDSVILSELALRLEGKTTEGQTDSKANAVDFLIGIIERLREIDPESFLKIRSLAHVSEDHKRVNQYETIIALYNEKIAKLRAQDMDEEDKEESIQAMKRLLEREIELLTNAEVING